MYKSRRYRSKELKRALLCIQQMKRKERRYNPADNIIPGTAKPGDKLIDLEAFGLWRRTRQDHFKGDEYVGGTDPDGISEGNFSPSDKLSDTAGLRKLTRPDEY